MPRMLFACAWALFVCALNPQAYADSGAKPLTLDAALTLALAYNPQLVASEAEIRAYEAEARQAGLLPNPELELEVENWAGSGELSGTDSAETTLLLRQTIELGGKRQQRRNHAEAETALASSRNDIARAELRARTTGQFVAVLGAQQRLQLADELVALARRGLSTVEERIGAGKAPASERNRSRILLAELEIARNSQHHQLAAERQQLAALLGGEIEIGALAGELERLPHLPELAELEGLLEQSPLLTQWDARRHQLDQALRLEEARAVPDLALGIGLRHDNDSDERTLVAGLSIPLPLFDRNQGAIAASRSRVEQVRAEQRDALLQARAELSAAWRRMSAAHEEAEALREQVLPAAEQACSDAEYGYRAGKFPLLDVLDAQRTLIEARQSELAALTAFHQAVAELERLLGSPLPGLVFTTDENKENTPS